VVHVPAAFVGDGKGNWKDASNGLPRENFCGGGMAFGDANKDGKMDVAIADHCRGAYVFLGDGAGNWKTWHFAIFSQMSIGESRV
jgi:hypothetical protein